MNIIIYIYIYHNIFLPNNYPCVGWNLKKNTINIKQPKLSNIQPAQPFFMNPHAEASPWKPLGRLAAAWLFFASRAAEGLQATEFGGRRDWSGRLYHKRTTREQQQQQQQQQETRNNKQQTTNNKQQTTAKWYEINIYQWCKKKMYINYKHVQLALEMVKFKTIDLEFSPVAFKQLDFESKAHPLHGGNARSFDEVETEDFDRMKGERCCC